MRWQVGRRRLQWEGTPRVRLMGVVNVTPDSFSDGGRFLDPQRAIAHGLQLVAAGADLLDVGGESTRPGADPVPADLELARIIPVIEGLRRHTDVPLSVDTHKAAVAAAAVEAGADIINDISALGDPDLARVAASTGCGLVLMHKGDAAHDAARRPAATTSRATWWRAWRRRRAEAAGVVRASLCLDPGIGFGKTAAQCVALLAELPRLGGAGASRCWWACRASRSWGVIGRRWADRAAGTVAAHTVAVRAGAMLRVHDAADAADAVAVASGRPGGSEGGMSSSALLEGRVHGPRAIVYHLILPGHQGHPRGADADRAGGHRPAVLLQPGRLRQPPHLQLAAPAVHQQPLLDQVLFQSGHPACARRVRPDAVPDGVSDGAGGPGHRGAGEGLRLPGPAAHRGPGRWSGRPTCRRTWRTPPGWTPR
ncbi:MAG: dihydropteroate synthase [bacterium]